MSYHWGLTSLLSLLQAYKHVLQFDCTQPLVMAVVVVTALVTHADTGCALSSMKEGG